MFPQSELDNYKLQVELLQEKLQRSEISRQQLEHKLDKIIHKREEQEKSVRSKSKQRYQNFLDEQQQRNERNKQLVHMLERIEQQTIAMNSRSERLKMMKLQYEMYFAKLVHSQTRRCIQNSTTPMATTPGPMAQTMTMPPSPADGYKYNKIYEDSPLMSSGYQRYEDQPFVGNNNYQRYGDPSIMERELFNRPQRDIMPAKIIEMPTRDYNINSDRSDYLDMEKPKTYHMPEQFPADMAIRDIEKSRPYNDNTPQPREHKTEFHTNRDESKQTQEYSSEPNLSNNNSSRQYVDLDLPTTSTATSSAPLTLERNRMPNLNMLSNATKTVQQQQFESKRESTDGDYRQNVTPDQHQLMSTRQQNRFENNSITSGNEPVSDSVGPSQISNERQEFMPINPEKYLEETIRADEIKIPSKQDMNPSVRPPAAQELKQNAPENTTNVVVPQIAASMPTPKSATPVSIENIENAIYGEIVNSAEEAQKAPQPDKPTASPTLLENLVTQAPINTEQTNPEQQYVANQPIYEATTSADNIAAAAPLDTQNYPQTYDYSTPTSLAVDDGSNNVNADFTGYENNGNALDEAQQQQQYDYSNYDPSQYSYPGYIYDETTGEYKPDPNAPPDQYAADQQYTQEYDQQYQQQQQEAYDYNQVYGQQELQAADPATYQNYDTTQAVEQTDALAPQSQVVPEPQEEQSTVAVNEKEASNTEPADIGETVAKNGKPTSILATADKKDAQKNKKRVNFVESSETDESSVDKGPAQSAAKPTTGNESDFDFSSGSEASAKKA